MWTGIELLHIMQDIRTDLPFLTDFFSIMSSQVFYIIIPMMMVIAIAWLYDKDVGEAIGLGLVSSVLTKATVKLIVAQPRPWVLDPSIEYVPGSHADGYSFPSGHTTASVASYLPAAWFFRKRVLLSVILVVTATLTVLGRLVLCVHTPIDVIVGAAIAIAMTLLAFRAVDAGKRSERAFYTINAAYLLIFTILALYSCLNTDADLNDIMGSSGFFYGFVIGRIFEHRYVGYTVKERDAVEKIKVYLNGAFGAAVLLGLPMLLLPAAGTLIGGLISAFWCIGLYPMVMKRKDW